MVLLNLFVAAEHCIFILFQLFRVDDGL